MDSKIRFEPSRLAEYTDDNILDEIKRVINGKFYGKVPSIDIFDQYSRVKSQTIRKRSAHGGMLLKRLATIIQVLIIRILISRGTNTIKAK